jgi:hypothetical protein
MAQMKTMLLDWLVLELLTSETFKEKAYQELALVPHG